MDKKEQIKLIGPNVYCFQIITDLSTLTSNRKYYITATQRY